MTKKVVLFLVEGITDQVSLGLILTRLLNNEQVHFEITEGDMTSREGTTIQNIKEKISHEIKVFMGKKRYTKADLDQVVHLIDTDGAFVPDSAIVPTDTGKTYYSHRQIFAKDCQAMAIRNHLKREIVTLLHHTDEIYGVPYQIYYFSRNIEHALHNLSEELSNSHKKNLAERMEDYYYNDPKSFLRLISSSEVRVHGDYQKTWQYIKEGRHSLQRGSNFYLYFRSKNL